MAKKPPKLKASDILAVLQEKHSDDVFIPECKNGPSEHGSLRLDAWTMKKSWANQCFTGYEIKITRGDFMNDIKWHQYLNYCNEFYFVCPAGLIKSEEIGEQAGLMWVSANGTRAWRKKMAPRLTPNIDKLNLLLQYVLMYRIKIVTSTYGTRDHTNPKVFWENWLKEKKLDWEFGNHVSKQISKRIRDGINNQIRENQKLQSQISTYEWLENFLIDQGLSIHSTTWKLRKDLEKLSKVVPESVFISLQQTQDAISGCQQELSKLLENSQNDVHVSE